MKLHWKLPAVAGSGTVSGAGESHVRTAFIPVPPVPEVDLGKHSESPHIPTKVDFDGVLTTAGRALGLPKKPTVQQIKAHLRGCAAGQCLAERLGRANKVRDGSGHENVSLASDLEAYLAQRANSDVTRRILAKAGVAAAVPIGTHDSGKAEVLHISVKEAPPKYSRMEALHKAAAEGDLETLRGLWAPELGAAKDKKGRTALIYAALEGSLDSLRCLVELGANLEVRDFRGRTAVLAAAEAGNIEAMNLLRDLGADETVRDARGFSIWEAARCQPQVRKRI